MKTPPHPVSETRVHVSFTPKKSLVEAYILAFALGWLGAHHFYLRRPWFGVVYFFTFGLLGVGYLVDLFRLPCLVKQANELSENPSLERRKNLSDAYVLWFPFGLLGFHLFYLRKPLQGFIYFFTFGLLGIGFLVDLFRIPSLVKAANQDPPEPEPLKSMCSAHILGLSPLGIIGAHHYYLDRPLWGLLYTMTFGLGGVGWVYDWFRLSFLVKRSNAIFAKERDGGKKYLDDIYILWFPFGFLGLHHYYLNRPGWGVLYLFTFGILGIGWLVDIGRLPCLISEYNRLYSERRLIATKTQQTIGGQISNTATGQTVITVTHMTTGGVMTPPTVPGVPPPYSYQNMTSYPPQGAYPDGAVGYPHGLSGYQNQGFYPTLPNSYATPAAPPMPPSYDESLAPPQKTGPPPEVHTAGKGNTD